MAFLSPRSRVPQAWRLGLLASLPAAGLGQAPMVAPEAAPARLFVREYRVLGANEFPGVKIEEVVLPFLGPGRTTDDVEAARQALEKAYHDEGYQAASVEVPPQHGRAGIVFLKVNEGRIGQVRVKGSRYFLPSQIKEQARSLAEGRALNFNHLTRDLVALNQLPDRQITPEVRAGAEPGTVDVDLIVKDKLPLHGSLELNNRQSPDTSLLRLNGALSYNNLWQQGHSVGASFQLAPQEIDEVQVYSGYYIWRFPSLPGLSLLLQGTKSNSNVSTLGAFAVAGRGETLGARAIWTLPPGANFYHSLSVGLDYKHTEQTTLVAQVGAAAAAPITYQDVRYVPISANYSATWAPKGAVTELSVGVTAGLRGVGTRTRRDAAGLTSGGFEDFRAGAEANFITLRGELAHTHDLPAGFELYGRVQGQVADQPLINTEQFAGGGTGTVRGYLEAEALGDNAIFGTLELRSPSFIPARLGKDHEWRVTAFADGGRLTLRSPLPEQQAAFHLASVGLGTEVQFSDFFHAAAELAWPLVSEGRTQAGDPFLHFRVWADF